MKLRKKKSTSLELTSNKITTIFWMNNLKLKQHLLYVITNSQKN